MDVTTRAVEGRSSKPEPRPRDKARPDLLSIVCPAYNEEDALPLFAAEIRRALAPTGVRYEIVFVNDGSADRTLSVMNALADEDPAIVIVDLSRNFGKEIATSAGLDHAAGEAVIVIDADLQDPPGVIPELIEGWRRGYDIVNARRRTRDGEGPLKRATAAAFYRLMRKVDRVELPENVGDFRLMSRKAVDAVRQLRERHRFMKGVFAWVGFPTTEILFDRPARIAGSSKWNYWSLWNLSIEALTSSTLAPLKVSTYFGFMVAMSAFVAGLFFIIKTIFFGDPVAGFPTLIVVILFLGGVQLIVLGVIGEYLGRTFNEAKNRPLYFVNDVRRAAPAPELPGRG